MDMSQQHMEYDESQHERPGASYTGYEAISPYSSHSTHPYGQKLAAPETNKMPTVGQRLALAIVSVVLWIALFLIIALIMVAYSPNPGGYEQLDNYLYPFLMGGFVIFTIFEIIVNFLFNRKR
jgi:uncharacterized membrane protein YbhN (UPF0104 family)